MRHIKDLTGQKFGMLKVLYCRNIKNRQGSMIWRCKCDCGKIKDVSSFCLTRNMTQSCGCKRSLYKTFQDGYSTYEETRYEKVLSYIDTDYDDIYKGIGLHKHTLYADDLKSICGVRL